jgi:DNA-binding HxlR family transcriptional regulator
MGVTSKVLTQTFRRLERDGLIRRTAYDESPPRVEYELTPLGRTLREPLAAIRDWAEVHLPEILAARERADGHRDDHRDR